MRKSLFCIVASILLVCLFIIPFNNADSSNFRDWPVPPFPKEVTKGNIPTDYNEYWDPWQYYVIYLALVLFVPMIASILFCCFIVCGCGCCTTGLRCSLHMCKIHPGILRNGKLARIGAIIPYCLSWDFVVVVTALLIAFFIWALIGWINLRAEAFELAGVVLDTPDQVITSIISFRDFIPSLATLAVALLNDILSFNTLINSLESFLNNTKANIRGIGPVLDTNFEAYQNVTKAHKSMVNALSGLTAVSASTTAPITNIDFTPFDSVFANSTTLITGTVDNALNQIDSAVQSGLSQVGTASDSFTGQITSFNTSLQNQMQELIDQAASYRDQIDNLYNQYVTDNILKQAELYTQLVEAAVGTVVVMIICFTAVILTCGFVCFCIPIKHCLCCLDICCCWWMLIWGFIGSIYLFTWCLSQDVCDQLEDYPAKVEDSIDLVNITIPTPPGVQNFTAKVIKFSAIAKGILNCETGQTYLSAAGMDFDSFGINALIESFDKLFDDALGEFDANSLIQDSLSGVNDFNNSIGISKDMDGQLSTMKNTLESGIGTFFATHPLYLTFADFETQDAQLARVNAILSSSYTRADIKDLTAPYYKYPDETFGDSVCTPVNTDFVTTTTRGDLKFLPADLTGGESTARRWNAPGPDYAGAAGGAISNAEKNELWGTIAGTSTDCTTPYSGGAHRFGLVYNLTRMNAPAPWNTGDIYDAYKEMVNALNSLSNSVQASEAYVTSLFNFQGDITNIVNSVETTVVNIKNGIKDFIIQAKDLLEDKLNATPIMKCENIGDFYRQIKETYCSNFKTAIAGSSVCCFLMIPALAAVFLSMLIGDYCIAETLGKHKKKKSKDYDSDYD